MDNSKVKFRRGNGEYLPDTITDGYISINSDNGRMFLDVGNTGEVGANRIPINGHLVGISDTPASESNKIVDIPGVMSYYEGMVVTVTFEHLNRSDISGLNICINGSPMDTVPIMLDATRQIIADDLDENVPYTFVYHNTDFYLVHGNLSSRPRWKGLTDDPV